MAEIWSDTGWWARLPCGKSGGIGERVQEIWRDVLMLVQAL